MKVEAKTEFQEIVMARDRPSIFLGGWGYQGMGDKAAFPGEDGQQKYR